MSNQRAGVFIKQFLSARNLAQAAPEWPLFRYRVKDEEYAEATKILTHAASLGYPGTPLPDYFSESVIPWRGPWLDMTFVLLASEWWRRNYVEGPVAYRGILEAVGIHDDQGERQNLQSLYPPISRGLKLWGRRIVQLNSKNRYLATLAGEGGIPIGLLRRSQSRLPSFFSAVLRDARDFRCRGNEILRLAESRQEMLPATQRQGAVFVATVLLVDAVIDLVPVLRMWDGKELFRYLDREDAEWRSRLPIDVSDEEAKTLFESLVEKARLTPSPSSGRPLHGQINLRKGEGGWQLIRTFVPPRTISTSSLAGSLGLSQDLLETRQSFDLFLQVEASLLVGLARASRIRDGRDGSQFLLELEQHWSRALENPDLSASVFLVAFEEGKEFARAAIPGLTLKERAPWVFEPEGDTEYRLLAQSTVKASAAEVIVLPPDGSEIRGLDGSTVALAPDFQGIQRTAWKIQGTARVVLPDGKRYSILTKQQADELYAADLSGVTKPLGEGRASCFVGPPDVRIRNVDGRLSRVPQDRVEWRPRVAGASWRPLNERCAGDIEIKYERDGDVVLDERAAVLPADFNFRVTPSTRGGELEKLEITGMLNRPEFIGLPANITFHWTNPRSRCWVAEFRVDGRAPSIVALATMWEGNSRLNLELPFPYRGARFIDRLGSVIRSESRIHVDLLSGIRAEVLSPQQDVAFEIEARLEAGGTPLKGENALSVNLPLPEIEPGQGRFQVDLGVLAAQIQFLFCATDHLDAVVDLAITTVRGPNIPIQRLTVARYGNVLEFDSSAGTVRIRSESPVEAATSTSELCVRARSLISTDSEPITLRAEERGLFRFDAAIRHAGPWMITGERNGWHEARPKLWTDEGVTGGAADLGALGFALTRPTRAERLIAIRELLGVVSADPSNSEWPALLSFFAAFRDLPPQSLDLFGVVVTDRDTLSVLTLHAAQDEELLRDLLGFLERLPFAWFLFPTKAWTRALSAYRDALVKSCPPDLAKGHLERAAGTLACEGSARIPGFEASFGAAWAIVAERDRPACIDDWKEPSTAGKHFSACQQLELEIRSGQRTFPAWHGLRPIYDRIVSETAWIESVFRWSTFEHHDLSRETVVNAPRVAAICVATSEPLSEMEIVHFRRIRSFSETAFDALFGLHLPRAIYEAQIRKPGLLN